LLVASILSGLLLWKQFMNQRRIKIEGLPSDRRHASRMWSVHLVCSNLGGLLFNILLGHEAHRWCRRWWLLAWSCTTWSSRMSAIKAYMNQGWEFDAGHLHLRISSICTKKFVIALLLISYRRIWLNIIGHWQKWKKTWSSFISSYFHTFPFKPLYYFLDLQLL
jgi:hypothetical protein